MIALDSTNLAGYEYDPQTQLLTVAFKHGRSYSYKDVPQAIADGLGSAPSPGQYFNSNIKNSYPTS